MGHKLTYPWLVLCIITEPGSNVSGSLHNLLTFGFHNWWNRVWFVGHHGHRLCDDTPVPGLTPFWSVLEVSPFERANCDQVLTPWLQHLYTTMYFMMCTRTNTDVCDFVSTEWSWCLEVVALVLYESMGTTYKVVQRKYNLWVVWMRSILMLPATCTFAVHCNDWCHQSLKRPRRLDHAEPWLCNTWMCWTCFGVDPSFVYIVTFFDCSCDSDSLVGSWAKNKCALVGQSGWIPLKTHSVCKGGGNFFLLVVMSIMFDESWTKKYSKMTSDITVRWLAFGPSLLTGSDLSFTLKRQQSFSQVMSSTWIQLSLFRYSLSGEAVRSIGGGGRHTGTSPPLKRQTSVVTHTFVSCLIHTCQVCHYLASDSF